MHGNHNICHPNGDGTVCVINESWPLRTYNILYEHLWLCIPCTHPIMIIHILQGFSCIWFARLYVAMRVQVIIGMHYCIFIIPHDHVPIVMLNVAMMSLPQAILGTFHIIRIYITYKV